MDQCFRIAVWMFFLVGYLQAAPCLNMDDLSFDKLQDVKCENVTFTFPTNVTECPAAALKLFEKGFGDAIGMCYPVPLTTESSKALKQTLNQTKGALKRMPMPQTQEPCNPNLTVHGDFANFVKAAETFVEACNNPQ